MQGKNSASYLVKLTQHVQYLNNLASFSAQGVSFGVNTACKERGHTWGHVPASCSHVDLMCQGSHSEALQRQSCRTQHGYSVCIRTVLCSESDGCQWGQRLSQDVVICILSRWSRSSFEKNKKQRDPNASMHHVKAELSVADTLSWECDLQLFYIYYSLWQEEHGAGFHNRASVHTSSCRFMSGKQHTKRPFLCMIRCLFFFQILWVIFMRSQKGMDYFFFFLPLIVKK